MYTSRIFVFGRISQMIRFENVSQFSNGGSGKHYVHAPDVGLVSMMMMGVSNESYYYHFDAIG